MNSTLDPQNCVVVASGTLDKVEQWTALLRNARIPFEVRKHIGENLPTREKHAELWVNQGMIDRVRSVIRAAHDVDKSLLW
jgi:hypothetical protein